MMDTKIPYELLAKYITGQATPEESDNARKWIEESHQNAELFSQLKVIWEKFPDYSKDFFPDIDIALKNVNNKLSKNKGQIKKSEIIKKVSFVILRIAAVFLLVAGSLLVYNQLNKPRYLSKVNESDHPLDLLLPDNSKVTLNKGAFIKYPAKFIKKTREIEFYGEAYFEVSKLTKKPFVIHTDNSYISVLGTSFNVRAIKDEPVITVSVTEGKVEFGSLIKENSIKIEVDAGNTGVLEKGKELKCIENHDLNFLSWKTGKLVFSKKPLGEALQLLEKYFSISVRTADNQLDSLIIDLTLYRSEKDEIIKTLEILLGHKIKEKDSIFIITSESI